MGECDERRQRLPIRVNPRNPRFRFRIWVNSRSRKTSAASAIWTLLFAAESRRKNQRCAEKSAVVADGCATFIALRASHFSSATLRSMSVLPGNSFVLAWTCIQSRPLPPVPPLDACVCFARTGNLRLVRLLDRYIGRQLLVTAILAVAVLSVVLVLGNIFKKLLDMLVNQNAPASLILSFIAYVLPFSLTFTIPWGFLTAVLLVFGRLSADNELTALRATGVSIPRACLSVWILAVVLTGICLWINLEAAPRAQQEMKNALFKIATGNPLAMFGSDKVIEDFPKRKIYVEKSDGNQLTNLFVYEIDQQNALKSVMYAREGSIGLETVLVKQRDGSQEYEKQIILKLRDGRYEQRDEAHPEDLSRIKSGITVEEGSVAISLRDLYEKKKKSRGVGGLPIGELLDTAKPEAVVELNKRVSNALATIAFALLAVPLAVTAQRKETSVGFAISLAIGLVYYLLFFLADFARSRPKLHPELLVWIPNVIFMAAGAWRFRTLARR
jgi:lipopolysaccharide export system permease protein